MAGLIAAVATIRATVAFVPQRYFDVDPAFSALPASGLGPTGSLMLDVLLLVLAGVGFAVRGPRSGGEWPRWAWAVPLTFVPAGLVLMGHGWTRAGDLVAGATWIAAAAAGLAMWRLTSGAGGGGQADAAPGIRAIRGVALAGLLAALIPLAVRASQQIRVGPYVGPEHATTLDQWAEQREVFLADRGWAENSSAARIFERRLLQPQPTGWFTTTNVFATVAGAGGVLALGLAAGAWRRSAGRSGSRPAAISLAVVGAASLGLVGLSGSKGAFAALALAVVPLAAWMIVPGLRRGIAATGPWFGLAVIVMALAAVVVRGQVGEDFAGDRSLLFRWHYMHGAAGVIAEHPGGVGADGFQPAYMQHRPERSPEEVASPHSVLLDWLAGGGLAAGGWGLLFGAGAFVAGRAWRRAGDADPSDPIAPAIDPTADDARVPSQIVGLSLVFGGWLTLIAADGAAGDTVTLVLRGVAIAGAGFAAIALGPVLARVAIAGPGLAAAAIMATAHGQVEMSFTQPGSAAWLLVLLGLAAGHGTTLAAGPSLEESTGAPSATPAPRLTMAAATCVLSLGLLVVGVLPSVSQSRVMARAAAEIATARGAPQARAAAASRLSASGEAVVPDDRLVVAAVRQWLAAAALDPPRAIGHLDAAEAAVSRIPGQRHATLRVDVAESRWRALAADPAAADAALSRLLAAAAVARHFDPTGPRPALRYARVLAAAGDGWAEEAADVAADALRLDDAKSLDPAKQLTPALRAELEAIAASAPATAEPDVGPDSGLAP